MADLDELILIENSRMTQPDINYEIALMNEKFRKDESYGRLAAISDDLVLPRNSDLDRKQRSSHILIS